jgi:hypothetical protein
MKNLILSALIIFIHSFFVSGQTGNRVLIEEFSETGCGACAQNDSAFKALMKKNADKVAIISYHCTYTLDTFYTYNKLCDEKYTYYDVKGYPSAIINGTMPGPNITHISYLNDFLIDKFYKKEPLFKFDISSTSGMKEKNHNATIKIKATSLKNIDSKDLRLYAVVTENNINYEERYHSKAINGLNEFDNIMRTFLPGREGTEIGEQTAGKENLVKVVYTNDDKEINYKEVRIVVFIQDVKTKEVLGATVTDKSPFK